MFNFAYQTWITLWAWSQARLSLARIVTFAVVEVGLLVLGQNYAFAGSEVEARDPYEVLGVPREADLERIEEEFRKLAKKLHPDLKDGEVDTNHQMGEIIAAINSIRAERKRKLSPAQIMFERRRLLAATKPYPIGMAVLELSHDQLRSIGELLLDLEQSLSEDQFDRATKILRALRSYGLDADEIAAIALIRSHPEKGALNNLKIDFIDSRMDSRLFQRVLLTGYIEEIGETGQYTLEHGLVGRVPPRDKNLKQLILRSLRKRVPEPLETPYDRLVDLLLDRLLEDPYQFYQNYFEILISSYPEVSQILFSKIAGVYAENPSNQDIRTMFNKLFRSLESVPFTVTMDFIVRMGKPWTFKKIRPILEKTPRMTFEQLASLQNFLRYEGARDFAFQYIEILSPKDLLELRKDVEKGSHFSQFDNLQKDLLERLPVEVLPAALLLETTDELATTLESWRSMVVNRFKLALYLLPREQRELGLAGVARAAGIAESTLSKIINGHSEISLSTGQKLALVLNVRPEWLMAMDVLQGRLSLEKSPWRRRLESKRALRELIEVALMVNLHQLKPSLEVGQICDVALTAVSDEDLMAELKRRGLK